MTMPPPSVPPPMPVPDPTELAAAAEPKGLALPILAAAAAGLVAAALYGIISDAIHTEILYAMIGVGVVPGLVLAKLAGRSGVTIGLIALVLGAVSVVAAVYLYVATARFGNFVDGIKGLNNLSISDAFSIYFTDPLGYVWALAGVAAAGFAGFGAAAKARAT